MLLWINVITGLEEKRWAGMFQWMTNKRLPVWNVQSANGEWNEYSHLVTWMWLSDAIWKMYLVKNNIPIILFQKNPLQCNNVFEQEQIWKKIIWLFQMIQW